MKVLIDDVSYVPEVAPAEPVVSDPNEVLPEVSTDTAQTVETPVTDAVQSSDEQLVVVTDAESAVPEVTATEVTPEADVSAVAETPVVPEPVVPEVAVESVQEEVVADAEDIIAEEQTEEQN